MDGRLPGSFPGQRHTLAGACCDLRSHTRWETRVREEGVHQSGKVTDKSMISAPEQKW